MNLNKNKNKLNKLNFTYKLKFNNSLFFLILFLFFLFIFISLPSSNNTTKNYNNLKDKNTKLKNENTELKDKKAELKNENNKSENTQKYIYHKSDKLFYNSKNKYFELLGNVELFYEDTKVRCDIFRYYEDKEFGIATGNPTLYNPKTFIKSNFVELYFKIKKLVAKNNVYIKIKNEQENNNNKEKNNKNDIKYIEIFTDTLTYNWENEIVYIPNKVKIKSTNLYLYADTLTYNVKNNLIVLKGNVYGRKDEQKIWADKLTYNTKTETLIMEGNVKSIIKSQQKKNEKPKDDLNTTQFKLLTSQEIYDTVIKENQKISSFYINKYLYSPYIPIKLNYYTTFDIYQTNDLNYYIYNIDNSELNSFTRYIVYIMPSNLEKAQNLKNYFSQIAKPFTNSKNNNKEIYFILSHKSEKYVFFENLNQLYNNLLDSYNNTFSLIYNNISLYYIYNNIKIKPLISKDLKFTYYKSLIISEIYDEDLIEILKKIYKKYNSAYINLNDIQNYNYLLKITENFSNKPDFIAFNLDSNLLSYLLTNSNFLNILNLNTQKIVLFNTNEIYNYLNNKKYFYSFCKYLFNLSYIYNLKIAVDSDIYLKYFYKELKPYFEIYFNK